MVNAATLFAAGFAAGLAAGTASCTAVQGGLLIGLVRPPGARGATCHSTPRVRTAGRANDAAVVGAFLGGRVVSHAAAGALLGLVGSAVQITPQVRSVLLVTAGIAVIAFALRLLRHRPDSTGCATSVPAQAGTPSRRGIIQAAGLGLATIVVPCGTTVSLEIVAVSTGSALGGAAVLTGFTLGSAPAFAALGLLLRGLAVTRLAVLAGATALVVGVITIGAGLRLGGWLPVAAPASAQAAARAQQDTDGTQRITIWATDEGFRPGIAHATAGQPLEIIFRDLDSRDCVRSVAINGRDLAFPPSGEVSVRLTHQPGRLSYTCGTGMFIGFITFEQPN